MKRVRIMILEKVYSISNNNFFLSIINIKNVFLKSLPNKLLDY